MATKIDKTCDGRRYWSGHSEFSKTCNYIFEMDERRPCPPGAGCTVRVEKKRKRKKNVQQ